MSGSVYDTYVAALQHDIADVPEGAGLVGVVRRGTPWFYGHVDENLAALGPPEELLDAFKERSAELEGQGLIDSDAQNKAFETWIFRTDIYRISTGPEKWRLHSPSPVSSEGRGRYRARVL